MNKKEFIEELKKINIEITNTQLEQLELYKEALITENKKYNLTAITKEEDIYLKHLKDFKVLTKEEIEENMKIIPFGTGKDIIIEGKPVDEKLIDEISKCSGVIAGKR